MKITLKTIETIKNMNEQQWLDYRKKRYICMCAWFKNTPEKIKPFSNFMIDKNMYIKKMEYRIKLKS